MAEDKNKKKNEEQLQDEQLHEVAGGTARPGRKFDKQIVIKLTPMAEDLNKKPVELDDEQLDEVSGGMPNKLKEEIGRILSKKQS